MWKQLKVGKVKLFSIGGKEVLLKVMVMAIPCYTVSLFKLPASLFLKLCL